MHATLRLAGATAAAASAVALAACTSGSSDDRPGGATATATPSGVYGAPDNPVPPEPTFVATDAPVTVAPTTDGSVLITYRGWNDEAGAVEVGSYVPGVVEADGICTLTLTRGEVTATTSGAGEPNVGTTSCGGLAVPGSELSSGAWSAVVTYESGASSATSEPVEVDVP